MTQKEIRVTFQELKNEENKLTGQLRDIKEKIKDLQRTCRHPNEYVERSGSVESGPDYSSCSDCGWYQYGWIGGYGWIDNKKRV